jgi:stearoyl-CoA desaturase (delta-9 desaturase)
MPPRNVESNGFSSQDDPAKIIEPFFVPPEGKFMPLRIRWRNVVLFALLHLAAVYGLFLTPYAHPYTWLFSILLYAMNALGITAGAHRLWTHRSYHATLPLKIFLAICNSIAFQNDIIEWSRDHRVHHKYSETDADPHNAKRGFFFAHCGWLMVRKHPDVKTKGSKIDMSDLLNDPVCAFQRKVYVPSVVLFCFLLPTVLPWLLWDESLTIAYFVPGVLRYVLALNATWLVNSAAHIWGNKPYDKHINPSENMLVSLGAMGEGFHNYHHTFPSDYSTSEFGMRLNLTTLFIDTMAWLGLADQRKKMTAETVDRRKERTGDGTKDFFHQPSFVHKRSKSMDKIMDAMVAAASAPSYIEH